MSSDTAARQATSGLDRFFKITERGSTVSRELRGGLVTFFTMAYIIVLNPIILLAGGAKDGSGHLIGGVDSFQEATLLVSVGTAVVAGVLCILMGVVANFPIALAAGLGINGLIAAAVITHQAEKVTYADIMGLVVIEGIIILVLVLTGFRKAVFEAIPGALKVAISVGIGLFIAYIGLIDAGFARRPSSPGTVPSELGIGGTLNGWPTVVFVFGVLVTAVLLIRKVKGAILIGIVAATVLAIIIEAIAEIGPRFVDGKPQAPETWGLTVPALPSSITQTPDLGILGQFNLLGSFEKLGLITALMFVFSLLLADFFDTMGTVVAIGTEADLLDEDGNPPNTDRILAVDSVAAIAGGAGGISSNTSYIESASGVAEGARTGLASIVTGVLFLLASFLAPLFAIVPSEAAAPALVLVGFLMMTQVRNIAWDDLEIGIPAFLTIALMPFTFNITVGIGAGFVAWVVLKVARGKAASVHWLLWVVAALFVVYFAKAPIEALLT